MSLSSVFVVTNALRLRLFQPKVAVQTCCDIRENSKDQEEENMEMVIKVEGMMCPHCKARVESVCKGVVGTTDAVVDLQQKQVTVTGTAEYETLKKVMPDFVAGRLYSALCDAFSSEVSARRTAMDSATKNAGEMISDLKLKFNRARQGAITQEITEIVAGAEQ